MTTNDKIKEAIGELESFRDAKEFHVPFVDELDRAILILRSILNDTATLDDKGREMFDTLWNGYPKQQWDG